MFGLFLGILMVVTMCGSIGVVAASGVEVDYSIAKVSTWYYGYVLSTCTEVSARNASTSNPAYVRMILNAKNIIVIRGASDEDEIFYFFSKHRFHFHPLLQHSFRDLVLPLPIK